MFVPEPHTGLYLALFSLRANYIRHVLSLVYKTLKQFHYKFEHVEIHLEQCFHSLSSKTLFLASLAVRIGYNTLLVTTEVPKSSAL